MKFFTGLSGMKFRIKPSKIQGSVQVPASKSHTIRALVIASMANGVSLIRNPLESLDTISCLKAVEAFGARVEKKKDWRVHGVGGDLQVPVDVIDVGNSGTTLYFMLTIASLCPGWSVLTGDEQIRRRPAESILYALNNLGGTVFSTRGNGMAPIVVKGPLRGGITKVSGVTSQYTSSLLLGGPLCRNGIKFTVDDLNEQPYVRMTMDWFTSQNIKFTEENMKYFEVAGGQKYHAFDSTIPGDFSSATFFLCAGALSDKGIFLKGLDMEDSQGDKAVVGILEKMGAKVDISEKGINIHGGSLKGGTFDMNAIPDALPALAVTACFSKGTTHLINVPQARLKETDRIKVMHKELEKMGGRIREVEDGLIIEGRDLRGAKVSGHGDHRVVMALSTAGLFADGETVVDTAESVSITFPGFVELMKGIGGNIKKM